MEGQHSLTENSIPKFAKALELDEKQARYFAHLVRFNEAKSLSEKDSEFESLMQLKSSEGQMMLEQAQYEYYKNWYNVAIRELLSYYEYQADASDMGKEFIPPIPAKKVKEAIKLLEELGLAEKGPDGIFRQTQKNIASGKEVQSLLIPKFHMEMGKMGVDSISKFEKTERYISGVTMSLTESKYNELIEKIRIFRQEIIDSVNREPDMKSDRVMHLNLQLFPLTRIKSQEGGQNPDEILITTCIYIVYILFNGYHH